VQHIEVDDEVYEHLSFGDADPKGRDGSREV
jgi:hypothetical protein